MTNLKLTKLHMSRLHHTELGQLIIRFIEDFEALGKDASQDEDFKKSFDSLKEQIAIYKLALNQIRGREETKKIASYDKERDVAFQALKNLINVYKTSTDPEEKDAYEQLATVLNTYKDLTSQVYEKETLNVVTLVEKLRSKEYASSVKLFNLKKFIDKLDAANTQFNKVFSSRSQKDVQKTTYEILPLKKKLIDDYQTLALYVYASAQLKKTPLYTEILAIINNGRKYFDTIITIRRKKKKNGESDDDKDNTGEMPQTPPEETTI